MEGSALDIDPQSVLAKLEGFLKEQVDRLHRDGAVVGLSGGVDSSVSAALAVRALGPDRVLGLIMPEMESNPDNKRDALALARQLRIPHKVVRLSRVLRQLGAYRYPWSALIPYRIRARLVRSRLDSWQKERKTSSFADTLVGLRDSDLRGAAARHKSKARTRMVVLYSHAERNNYLVVGTTNRSEFLIGFFTKYGDGAADVEPLVPLYKTQVRQLANHLGIPASIIAKAPSSDLAPGVTDELSLNLPYPVLDKILYCCEMGMSDAEVAEAVGVDVETVDYVRRLQRDSSHRRDPPAVPSLGLDGP